MKMIKKIPLLLLITGLLFSCQPEELSPITTEQISGAVDPNTPTDAQPLILNAGAANGRILSPPGSGWTLNWSDEFSGNTLDANKWVKSVSTGSRSVKNRDPALDDWWWVADHAFLDGNGELTLQASKPDHNTLYCGSVETRGLYETKYGFFEVRMKIAETAKGNHTAFWFQGSNMKNVDGTGNDGAEIDVFESAWVANRTKTAIHIDGYAQDHQSFTKSWNAPGIHNGYHTYGLNWTANKLEIYYDGVKVTEYTDTKWIPRVDEWIWLSVGASFADGDFGSQPNGFLSDAKVDYVRVWKQDQTPAPSTFRIVNKETGKWIKTYNVHDDADIKQANPSSSGNWTHWTTQAITSKYFYFVNPVSGKYFRPISNAVNSRLQLKPTSFSGSWTQWEMIDTGDGDGSVYLKNKETNKYIRPESASNDAYIILTESTATDNWVKWFLQPI